MFIGLLRAVNVGGRKLPMAELREICSALAWAKVETYIQSGNIVFEAGGDPANLETELEASLERKLGFAVPVMIRSRGQWDAIVAANPFAEAAAEEPNRLLAGIAKAKLAPRAAEAIAAKAVAGERVAQAGGTLWFHYPAGVGASKLTPSLIDRCAGSPVTARNWRTLLKLQEMVAQ
jgi:uncharacterized protein (DUF1697 family)